MTRHARIELAPVEGSTLASHPHFLRLVAANSATLAHSEMYSTRSNARRAATAWLDAMDDITHGKRVVEVQS